jgi:hypothetical protein
MRRRRLNSNVPAPVLQEIQNEPNRSLLVLGQPLIIGEVQMKRKLMIAAMTGALLLGGGVIQTAEAQHRMNDLRVSSGHHFGGGHWGEPRGRFYRSGYHGGGWGWGAGALLGGVAALATAPFWLAGGGYYLDPYRYDYGYEAYPVAYSAHPIYYYQDPAYVTYAPRRVIYASHVVHPRNVARVRYAQPRRVVVHRSVYRAPARVHARRVIAR